MADPRRPKVIGVKVPAANIGEYVKVTNLTSGGSATARISGTDRVAITNPGEDFAWNNGDTIQAEIHGRINGYARAKIEGGGIGEMAINASADTSTPGADL